MQNIRFVGAEDERVLSADDMLKLGFEDHPGLWFTRADRVVEVEDDLAEVLTSMRPVQFVIEPNPADDMTKDELLAEAKNLGVEGVNTHSTKAEIADAIKAKAHAGASPDEVTGSP